jgi:hypothetical protein
VLPICIGPSYCVEPSFWPRLPHAGASGIRTGARPLGSSAPSLKDDRAILRGASKSANQGTTASAARFLSSTVPTIPTDFGSLLKAIESSNSNATQLQDLAEKVKIKQPPKSLLLWPLCFHAQMTSRNAVISRRTHPFVGLIPLMIWTWPSSVAMTNSNDVPFIPLDDTCDDIMKRCIKAYIAVLDRYPDVLTHSVNDGLL